MVKCALSIFYLNLAYKYTCTKKISIRQTLISLVILIQALIRVMESVTKRPRDLSKKGHVLSVTRERGCHRVDMKNAAFVKMRDSVSFCKQILIEYVLGNQ
jgi:hypothetical protein